MPKARSFDQHAIRELGLFIENDSQLYHSQQLPIEKNLKLKGMKGKYDPRLAVKLWSYLIESGAKKYHKQFGSGGKWNDMFPKPMRDELARQSARAFEVEHPTLLALRPSKVSYPYPDAREAGIARMYGKKAQGEGAPTLTAALVIGAAKSRARRK
jgi:hypothetical protein